MLNNNFMGYVPTGGVPARFARQNVRDILESWADHHPSMNLFPWVTTEVEKGFCVPLHRTNSDVCACTHTRGNHFLTSTSTTACTIPFCKCAAFTTPMIAGRRDLAGYSRGNKKRRIIVDNKSTQRLDATFATQYEMDSQLSCYLWADEDASEAFINAIEISVLPKSDIKCKTHGVKHIECYPEHANFRVIGPITRTSRQLDEWHSNMVEIVARVYHNRSLEVNGTPIDGRFAGNCRYCEFREWCSSGRPTSRLDKQFTHRVWEPWRDSGFKPKKYNRYLIVDNSIAKAHTTCPTQERMRYGSGFTSEGQAVQLDCGIAVHAFFEVWFDPKTPMRLKAALAAFERTYTVTE